MNNTTTQSLISASRIHSDNARGKIRAGLTPVRESPELDFITPEYARVCVISGSGVYIDDKGKKFPFEAPCIFQRFPNVKHSLKWTTQSRTAYLAIPSEAFNLLKSIIHNDKFTAPIIQFTKIQKFIDETKYIINQLNRLPESQLILVVNYIQSLFSEILIEYDVNKMSLLAKADKYISDKIPEKVSLDDLSSHFAMSRSSLREKFMKEAGVSPGKYIINKRLAYASSLLTDGVLTIGEVSDKCGYPDIYTFSRQFKKFFGVTPSKYKKQPDLYLI